MTKEYAQTDKSANNNHEFVNTINGMKFYPDIVENTTITATHKKLHFSELLALGIGFDSLAKALSSVTKTSGEQLCKVTVPPGTHLATFKSGVGNLGTLLDNSTNKISGQAVINPIEGVAKSAAVVDPAMLIMAAALMNIEKRLDEIRETQLEILDFLKKKEKASLKGDLIFLTDILDNYKFNWNNEKYKNNHHIKVLDIKQASEKSIILHRGLIKSTISKKEFLHQDKAVKNHLNKILTEFEDYQLALYLFAFSSFLDIMLLDSYESGYLGSIKTKIEDYSLKYRKLYTDCYDQLESYANSSLQAQMLKGAAKINKAVGKAIAKIPVISKGQVDEKLMEIGDRIDDFGIKRTEQALSLLTEKQSASIRPYIENIETVNQLFNQPMDILFNNQYVYIPAVA